jgi:hypothetical protein
MDFEFLEIGETLAVGAIFLLAIWNLLTILKNKNNRIKLFPLKGFNSENAKIGYSAIFLSLTYLCGLIIENIATDISNDRIVNSKISETLFEKENNIMASKLFSSKVDPVTKDYFYDDYTKYLGYDFKQYRTFNKYIGDDTISLMRFDMYIKSLDTNNLRNPFFIERLEKVARNTYYQCKNRVYLESTYFKELIRIESRISILRSVLLEFAILTIIYYLFNGIYFINWLWKHEKRRKSSNLSIQKYSPYLINNWKPLNCRLLLMSIILLTLSIAVQTSYFTEQDNFYYRVYGYARSLKDPR